MSPEILIAVIAAIGVATAGLPAALIERARRENADDHATVRRRLDRIDEHLDEIEDSVDDVADSLVGHLEWHDKEADNDGDTRSTTSPEQ